jgi:hypothetical protein
VTLKPWVEGGRAALGQGGVPAGRAAISTLTAHSVSSKAPIVSLAKRLHSTLPTLELGAVACESLKNLPVPVSLCPGEHSVVYQKGNVRATGSV